MCQQGLQPCDAIVGLVTVVGMVPVLPATDTTCKSTCTWWCTSSTARVYDPGRWPGYTPLPVGLLAHMPRSVVVRRPGSTRSGKLSNTRSSSSSHNISSMHCASNTRDNINLQKRCDCSTCHRSYQVRQPQFPNMDFDCWSTPVWFYRVRGIPLCRVVAVYYYHQRSL